MSYRDFESIIFLTSYLRTMAYYLNNLLSIFYILYKIGFSGTTIFENPFYINNCTMILPICTSYFRIYAKKFHRGKPIFLYGCLENVSSTLLIAPN